MKGNPRYAIVRVDNNCPEYIEDFKCHYNSVDCMECSHHRYGDTKEQLIRKVAQVLFKEKLEIYKKVYGIIPNDKFMKEIYIKQLKVAQKIVEFLGVE